jgi:branched-chain amino acid transport system substrate-binding protein
MKNASTAFALAVALTSSVALAQTRATVGAIMPLSGPAATYGQSFVSVVPLAKDALKAEGIDLNVITEDGAADVPVSITAYNKLVRIDKVPAIVHSVSPVVLTLGPMGEKDKIVLINAMAGAPAIAKIGPHTFSTMPSYEIEGTDAAEFVYKRGGRKVFALYQDTAAGKAAWDVFKPAFQKLGGTIAGEEPYKAGATEYRGHLTRAVNAAPDWIYLSSYAAETGRILAQAHRMELMPKIKIMGIVGAAQEETISLGGPGAEGFIHANWPFDPENGTALMKKFGAAYKEKHGSLPSVYSATSYDSLMVLGRAMKAGANTGPEIQAYLSKKLGQTEGVTGKWQFNPQGQVVLKTSFVEIKNGKRVPVQ